MSSRARVVVRDPSPGIYSGKEVPSSGIYSGEAFALYQHRQHLGLLRCDFRMRWILLNVPSSHVDIAHMLVALSVTLVIRVQIILGKYRASNNSACTYVVV